MSTGHLVRRRFSGTVRAKRVGHPHPKPFPSLGEGMFQLVPLLRLTNYSAAWAVRSTLRGALRSA